MDCHLEKKIRLSENPEYNSLYPWSLQEINEKEEKVGNDQIPWSWSLYFTASELRHNYSVDVEKPNESDIDENTGRPQENEVITAILRSGACKNGLLEDKVFYSMFGTDRMINQFELQIHKSEESSYREKCHMWGCVSYTSEIDFRNYTTEDTVIIYLSLSPQRFEKITKLINDRCVDTLQICLSGVSGLYSEWSPSISTNYVKILADTKDQEVITQDGCQIDPPRLGDVYKFDMTVIQHHKLNPEQRLGSINSDKLFEEPTSYEGSSIEEQEYRDKDALNLTHLARNEAALAKLRFPIWLIFMVLCVLLIK